MVRVGVGCEDVGHPFPHHRRQQSLQMVSHVRPRIDNRHLAAADDVGAGAEEGEGPGIVGHNTPDQRRDLIDPAVVEL